MVKRDDMGEMAAKNSMDLNSVDLASPDLLANPDLFQDGPPHELFAEMRRKCPVMWSDSPEDWPEESGKGFWNITTAADASTVIQHPETFSSYKNGIMMNVSGAGGLELQRQSFVTWDPPRHTGPRTVLNSSFRPKLMRRLEGSIREIVVHRLNELVELGHFDLVKDFTSPVTRDVISDLIGIEPEDRDQLSKWAQSIVVGDDPELVALYGTAEEGRRNSFAFMQHLLEKRRAEPREDFATYISTAQIKGEDLSEEDRVGILRLTMEGGSDTTIATIAHGVETFSEHPDQWELLLNDRSLIPQAIEEVLRWTAPVAYLKRTATMDVELGDQQILEGDSVVSWLVSTNRDPQLIDNPDVFDITRKTCPHHAFGAGGPHQCPGSGLARLQMRIVFEELLERTPDIRLDGPVERVRSNKILGLKSVPVRFTPSKPRP